MNRERRKNNIRDKKKLIYSHIRFNGIFSANDESVYSITFSRVNVLC